MKIGIIVHSFSGNTLSVAEKLRDRLVKKHTVTVERIQVAGGEQQGMTQFQLENPPDVSAYDAVIFGAPVRGFSVSPVIDAYLKQLASLKGKKVVCFVTKTLANNWTGGTRAIKSMSTACEAKGGDVADTGIIYWKDSRREASINEFVERIATLF